MSYTYIRREQTLEELGACVISQAAAFADDCARHGPIPRGLMRRSFSQMLERLERGDVLDERDDALTVDACDLVIERLGVGLRWHCHLYQLSFVITFLKAR